MEIHPKLVSDTALLEKGIPDSLSGERFPGGVEGKGAFEGTLHRVETERLIRELDSVAEQLFRYPSEKVLARYRSVVGRLLDRAEEMISLRADYSVRSGGARILVDRTRRNLEDLDRVLRREGARTRIMGITEDIRGCIVSLVV